ncbi:MAG: hypothetical protein JXB39_16235 [Deltaproteobacteria bacterium]|nr:hypothetical protein [Deltaproteobacteria bacterium]
MSPSRTLLPAGVLAAALGMSSPAGAAVLPLPLDRLTDASDYVVRGVVSALWVEEDLRGVHWTHAQVEVLDVYKGPSDLDALEVTWMGGILGTEGTFVPDAPVFDEQEPILLFAEHLPAGIVSPTGLAQGKFTIRIDPDSGQEIAVRWKPPAHMPYDHRFVPLPPARERTPLTDLVTRVRQEVAR